MPPDAEPELRPSGGEEARNAVEAVLREQAEREARMARAREEQARRSDGHGGAPLAVVTMLLAAVSVSVWTSPPAWARPEPFPDPTPRRLEAGLRMDLWVALQRVQVFQERQKRLPVLLGEAVEDPSERADLRYERNGEGGFRLVGSRNGIVVTYESGEAPESLTDAARAVLDAGRDR